MVRVTIALLAVWMLGLAGCGWGESDPMPKAAQGVVIETNDAVLPEVCTPQATYTALPTHTAYPTYTIYPTYTPREAAGDAERGGELPVKTPSPSPTPDTHEIEDALGVIRVDVDQEQERDGVILGVSQLVLMPFSVVEQQGSGAPVGLRMRGWDDVQTLVGMRVWVTNTTASRIDVYPEQGQVVVGDEQVDLRSFPFVSDDIGGHVRPGVTQDGVVWFGIKRLLPDQVQELVYYVNPPVIGTRLEFSNEYMFVIRAQ